MAVDSLVRVVDQPATHVPDPLKKAKAKGDVTVENLSDDTLTRMTADQVFALDGDVDLLLSPDMDLLADADLAYKYAADPEPWERFLDGELSRLMYYAPAPPPSTPSLEADSASGDSDSDTDTDPDPDQDPDSENENENENENQYTAYWESVASTRSFTAPRMHICHVMQHYLACPDPVLGAVTAAAALDQGYADLVLPGTRRPRERVRELKTGRRMAGYLWALWTTVVELVRTGADPDMLVLLLHKLRRLPGRTFAQWAHPMEGPADESTSTPTFRSVKAWAHLTRLDETISRAWSCSSHTSFLASPAGAAQHINLVAFAGRLFADSLLRDWDAAAHALDRALNAASRRLGRFLPPPAAARHALAFSTFVDAAGPALLDACVRERDGLSLRRWEAWLALLDDLVADGDEAAVPAACAREAMLTLLEEAVEALPGPGTS